MAGNTADSTTLRGFLDRIERQYGKARRIWVMLCAVDSYVELHCHCPSERPFQGEPAPHN
jgi:hypothetical protein